MCIAAAADDNIIIYQKVKLRRLVEFFLFANTYVVRTSLSRFNIMPINIIIIVYVCKRFLIITIYRTLH